MTDFDAGTPPAEALENDHLFAAWTATVAGEESRVAGGRRLRRRGPGGPRRREPHVRQACTSNIAIMFVWIWQIRV